MSGHQLRHPIALFISPRVGDFLRFHLLQDSTFSLGFAPSDNLKLDILDGFSLPYLEHGNVVKASFTIYTKDSKSNFLLCIQVQYIGGLATRSHIFPLGTYCFCLSGLPATTCYLLQSSRQPLVSSLRVLYHTGSLGALRAPTSSWRPFRPLDFVLRAPRALRPRDLRR